ncbi:hypothetical protein BTHI11S_00226 [Bosea thiooxidans]
MAGGAGTRLWPVSRDSMPKQFITLLDDGLSTFQATLLRVAGAPFGKPIVITNHEFRFVAAEQMQAVGVAGEIVLEPERRDSAAAVAVGALLARGQSRDAVAVALAADHVIMDAARFRADCLTAAELAAGGLIMTLGIVPTAPSTAYGYIEAGESLDRPGASRLARFVEKPDVETAQGYLDRGFLWNSGNFVFSAATMIEELTQFSPEVLAGAGAALDAAKADLDFLRLDPTAFAAVTRISIDYAVMEKTRKAGVLAAGFDWSDIGSWESIHEVIDKDNRGNVIHGSVVAMDSANSLLRSDDMLVTAIGLRRRRQVVRRRGPCRCAGTEPPRTTRQGRHHPWPARGRDHGEDRQRSRRALPQADGRARRASLCARRCAGERQPEGCPQEPFGREDRDQGAGRAADHGDPQPCARQRCRARRSQGHGGGWLVRGATFGHRGGLQDLRRELPRRSASAAHPG